MRFGIRSFQFLVTRSLATFVKKPNYIQTMIQPNIVKVDTPIFKQIFTPQLEKLVGLFKSNGYEIRIAGGAVRDILMGIVPADLDFASTATPEQMKDMFEKEQIRMLHKRGEEHGTITCRLDDVINFEITTLRVDVVCDGRRAEVQYTTDWQLDANRRDLTINSMFLDFDGNVIDYFGGVEDVKKKRIAFVGDAENRIQEDYLRILRYFRFFGRMATTEHEQETLEAIKKNSHGLKGVSAERIWVEFRRIVVGRNAPQVVRCMLEECELNSLLGLPSDPNLDRLAKVYDKYSSKLEPMTAIGSLLETKDQVQDFHKVMKLSNADLTLGQYVVSERETVEKSIENVQFFKNLVTDADIQPSGLKLKISGKLLASQLAISGLAEESLVDEIIQWDMPSFPVKGTDLMTVGVPAGPKMRLVLLALYNLWKDGYHLTKEQLLEEAPKLIPQVTEGVDDGPRAKRSKKSK